MREKTSLLIVIVILSIFTITGCSKKALRLGNIFKKPAKAAEKAEEPKIENEESMQAETEGEGGIEEVPFETIEGEEASLQEEGEREQVARTEEELPKVETVSPTDELTRMAEEEGKLTPIYFDFDRFSIRDDAKAVLTRIVDWLKAHEDTSLRIQGHADERGSNEYNLALGDRRAQSAKNYLVALGISSSRLKTISYGEEMPVDPRHTEEAWAKNRRVEFEIISR